MKSEKNKNTPTIEKSRENNDYTSLISGMGAFASFLTSIILLMDFTDKSFNYKSEDSNSPDKSSLFIVIFFNILTVICGYIYINETKNQNDDQSNFWSVIKEFFGETGEQIIQLFMDEELIGVDKNNEE